MYCTTCGVLSITVKNNRTCQPFFCGNCGVLFKACNFTRSENNKSTLTTSQELLIEQKSLTASLTTFKIFDPFVSPFVPSEQDTDINLKIYSPNLPLNIWNNLEEILVSSDTHTLILYHELTQEFLKLFEDNNRANKLINWLKNENTVNVIIVTKSNLNMVDAIKKEFGRLNKWIRCKINKRLEFSFTILNYDGVSNFKQLPNK